MSLSPVLVELVRRVYAGESEPRLVAVGRDEAVRPWAALTAVGWTGLLMTDEAGRDIPLLTVADGPRLLRDGEGWAALLAAAVRAGIDAAPSAVVLDGEVAWCPSPQAVPESWSSATLVVTGAAAVSSLESWNRPVLRLARDAAVLPCPGVAGETVLRALAAAGRGADAADAHGFARAATRWAEESHRRWRSSEAVLRVTQSKAHDAQESLARRLRVAEAALAAERVVTASLTARVCELEASTSWRLTAPLRRLSGAARRTSGGTERVPGTAPSPASTPSDRSNSSGDPTAPDRAAVLARRSSQVLEALDAAAADGPATLRDALGAHPVLGPAWWLAYAVLTGSLPTEEDMLAVDARHVAGGTSAALAEVERRFWAAPPSWATDAEVEIVARGILTDGSFTATTALQTGVQRVVRNTTPHWLALGARPVVLDEGPMCWRDPTPAELAGMTGGAAVAAPPPGGPRRVLVPWACDVLTAELKPPTPVGALRAASRWSGSRFSWVVYDLIPLMAPEYVPADVVSGVAGYASVIKHAHRVAAVSRSAVAEFSGFARAAAPQGLAGPEVVAVPAPLAPPPPRTADGDLGARAVRRRPDLPLVLYVGSISPHKNQASFLEAAAAVARRGARFELLFVAPNAWHATEFRRRLEELRAEGLEVGLASDIPDAVLWSLYRSAHVVALLSRVEGYGLPVVEALSVGVPVLTSSFGSMAENAAGGGVVTVDPWRADAVVEELDRILTDPEHHAALAEQAARRPHTSWETYARRTWDALLDLEGEADE